MRKLFYLKTCSTCQRIMKEVNIDGFEIKNIKEDKITAEELLDMRSLSGSYNALFSKTAMKYKTMGLKEKNLTEEDMKELILSEYTFLKRPVFIIDKQIFIGSKKDTVQELKNILN